MKKKVLQKDFTGKVHYTVFQELEIGSDFLNPKIYRIKSKLSHSNYMKLHSQRENAKKKKKEEISDH